MLKQTWAIIDSNKNKAFDLTLTAKPDGIVHSFRIDSDGFYCEKLFKKFLDLCKQGATIESFSAILEQHNLAFA